MNEIELIKSKIDIVQFLSDFITLKKAGRNFKALCPFHSEKTPSFIVSTERQSWHCFGACSEGGDCFAFLQKWENIEFIEALKILASKAGVRLSGFTQTKDTELKDKLYEINHLTSEFYHFLLTSHSLGQKALAYLQERGIKKEIIDHFHLGYAPSSWDSLMKYLLKKGYKRDDIYQAGLIVRTATSIYDRFRGRLMFSLRDHRGNYIGFSGRILPPATSKEAKYINTPETPLYVKGRVLYGLDETFNAIKKAHSAVVVEGEFDFLASYQSGVSNVVAIKGSALTYEQILLLKRYTEQIILALDSDFAGNEAAKRGIELLEKEEMEIRVVNLLFGKDPAECIAKGAHLWKESIKKAVPFIDFIFFSALEKYDKTDVSGKKNIGSEVIPFLAKIQNPIVCAHYIKKLAKELEVNEESVQSTMFKFQKTEKVLYPTDEMKISSSREQVLEEYLLALIFQSDDIRKVMKTVSSIINDQDFSQSVTKTIFAMLSSYMAAHDKFSLKQFSKFITSEIEPTFDKIYLTQVDQITSNQKLLEKELISVASEIKKLSLRRKITHLSTQIRQADKDADQQTNVNKLQEELRQLISNLQIKDKSL